jgi:hypothetical protein
MELVQAERTPAMNRAHEDERVQRIVANFLRAPSTSMAKLLAQALWGNWDPRSAPSLAKMAGVAPAHATIAADLATDGLAIANDADEDHGRRCRGAVLEALSEQLLRRRALSVLTEQQVGPFPDPPWTDGLSDPIDIIAVAAAHEFYECKASVRDIASKHIEQFRIVGEVCPDDSLVGFITLQATGLLVGTLMAFNRTCTLHGYALEDFVEMAASTPGVMAEVGSAA